MKNKNILLLIVVLIMIAIIYAVVSMPTHKNNTNTNDKENKISGNSLTIEELVQDATYTFDTSGSYKVEGEEYSLKNIVVPYFLFETEDAKIVNQQIETLYQSLAKEFQNELNGKKTNIVECWYDAIRVKGILSINITVQRKNETGVSFEYHPYVFDLDDLELMSYSNQVNKAGILKMDLDEKVEGAIRKLDDFKNLKQEDCPKGKTPDDYVSATMKIYKDAVENNTIISYVDAVKRLNIIIPIEIPKASGDMQRIITVK